MSRVLINHLIRFFVYFNLCCASSSQYSLDDHIILISTIDGNIEALDGATGITLWTLKNRPLLVQKSTLTFSNDQNYFQIVPSLDGLLYFLEGNKDSSKPTSFNTLKTFPIDIARATQSNLKFTDTSILTGSTDYGVFAVHLETGGLIYNCSNYGCKQNLQTNSLEEGTLLLFRETSSSIREIGILDGSERWNFTVRDTDISMIAANLANSNPSSINQARDLFQSSKRRDEAVIDFDYRFDLLTNVLTVYSQKTELWSRGIEAPIIRAWACSPYHLIKSLPLHKSSFSHQMVFLNQYQDKLFVQKLNNFKSAKAYSKTHHLSSLIGFYTSQMDAAISTQLAPYRGVTSRQECSAIDPSACEEFNAPLQISFIPSIASSFAEDVDIFPEDEDSFSDWVFDSANDFVALFTGGGYTLGSTSAYRKSPKKVHLHTPLFMWLFHLTAFVIFVYVVFKLLHLNEISLNPYNVELEQVLENTQAPVEPPENSNQPYISEEEEVTRPTETGSSETNSESNFFSTYDSEFQHLRLLGRGGFGFVFEVVNRLDGCRYAIKRIRLQNTPYEKVKFMREVKLWAMLDHPGIVRYHRAWVESPPAHWQEQRDRSLRLDEHEDLFDEESYDTTTGSPGFSIEASNTRQSNWKISSNSFGLPKAFTENAESLEFSLKFSDSPFCYLYIQMQLCSPKSLRDWLEARCTEESRPIRTDLYSMFQQIVEAVSYLHNKSLMHRDLKPSNILFDLEGRIKLADFGLVTRLFEPDPQTKEPEAPKKGRVRNSNSECQTWNDESWMSDAKRTSLDFRHTDNVGTLLYMSPEQEKGQSYDHHVDIFSLGLIFLELMIPFKTTMERICCLTKAKKQELPPEFKERHTRESELALMMLALEPNRRPETHDLLSHEIFRYGGPFTSPTITPESPINEVPRTRRRLRTLSRVNSMELF